MEQANRLLVRAQADLDKAYRAYEDALANYREIYDLCIHGLSWARQNVVDPSECDHQDLVYQHHGSMGEASANLDIACTKCCGCNTCLWIRAHEFVELKQSNHEKGLR